MPISFPSRLLRIAATLLILPLCGTIHSQVLARPGWAGSGMNSAPPWWRHALVYRVDPRGFGGLKGVGEHLSYIRSTGADALLLSSLGGGPKEAIDPSIGTMDDVDEIIRRASQDNLRVLAELDAASPDLAARARMWCAHGIAGFYVPKATPDQIAEINRASSGLGGKRILMSDVASTSATSHGATAPELVVDERAGTQEKFTAATVRSALEAVQQETDNGHLLTLLTSDGPALKRSLSRYGNGSAGDVEIAKQIAALLMTTRAGAMLFYGQELGLTDGTQEISFATPEKNKQPAPMSVAAGESNPASLLNWYRQLSAMMHSNRTISSGSMITLNHDDQNVLGWVRKPQAVSYNNPPIVILENLSDQPVQLSLKADIQKLHLRGSFLRTLLRSDNVMGAMHLEGMTLAPHAVFIGELKY